MGIQGTSPFSQQETQGVEAKSVRQGKTSHWTLLLSIQRVERKDT